MWNGWKYTIFHTVSNKTEVNLPIHSLHLTSWSDPPEITPLCFQPLNRLLCIYRNLPVSAKEQSFCAMKSTKHLISNSQRKPSCFIYGVPVFCSMLPLHNNIPIGQGCIDLMNYGSRQAVEYFKRIQNVILHLILSLLPHTCSCWAE